MSILLPTSNIWYDSSSGYVREMIVESEETSSELRFSWKQHIMCNSRKLMIIYCALWCKPNSIFASLAWRFHIYFIHFFLSPTCALRVMKNKDVLRAFEWNDESANGTEGMYAKVIKHKESNPGMKVLLSYGGYSFGSTIFTVRFIHCCSMRSWGERTFCH